jgi:quercetin dioxygenase-like cupin family protein
LQVTEAGSDGMPARSGSANDQRSEPQTGGPASVVLLGSEDTNDSCALVLSVECPGDEPPFHLHEGEDEICYVLEGSVTYYTGDRRVPAEAGHCAFIPRGVEHSFKVQTERARVLTMYVPGGFEGFVRELGSLAIRSLGSYKLERLIAVAARYGCEITGQPP